MIILRGSTNAYCGKTRSTEFTLLGISMRLLCARGCKVSFDMASVFPRFGLFFDRSAKPMGATAVKKLEATLSINVYKSELSTI
jgi:hypothetical protein